MLFHCNSKKKSLSFRWNILECLPELTAHYENTCTTEQKKCSICEIMNVTSNDVKNDLSEYHTHF